MASTTVKNILKRANQNDLGGYLRKSVAYYESFIMWCINHCRKACAVS